MAAAGVNGNKDHAEPLWDRAEQCRAIADLTTDAEVGAEYLRLAEAYLELAAKEEALAKRSK
jgi:hypothetical protein